ncbi:MAG: energy transducer TonB [Rhodospirillales bacterium]|nr:energy transducer TonB [Rhodospirillales bacterium]
MGKSVIISLLIHSVVVVLSYFGIPLLRSDELLVEAPVIVELVDIAEQTNLPAAKPKPKPEPPKAEPKKETPPPPPPPTKAEAPPPPPPTPEPEPEAVALPIESKPKPKPKPKPEPKPEPVAKPKPKAPQRLAKAKPKRKPKPPDAFASVLKSLEQMRQEPAKPAPKKKQEPKKDFEQEIAKVLASSDKPMDHSKPITLSEIDAVRHQIAQCWSLPAGAKDAENLIIEIAVVMNPDGKVRTAEIKNSSRMSSDSFYRAAAESAFRAVLNPRCQPFKLPLDKYDRWKSMTLRFNPKEMFGQ